MLGSWTPGCSVRWRFHVALPPAISPNMFSPALLPFSSFVALRVDAGGGTSRHDATSVLAEWVTSRVDSRGDFPQGQSPHEETAGLVGSIHGSPVMGRINGSTNNYVGRPESEVIGSLRFRRAFDLDRRE